MKAVAASRHLGSNAPSPLLLGGSHRGTYLNPHVISTISSRIPLKNVRVQILYSPRPLSMSLHTYLQHDSSIASPLRGGCICRKD